MKYDVFISYSRKDTAIADKICAAFDRAGITYFIDRQGIGGAYEFPEVLANAILDSKLFLYLASENAYKSKFTNSEITFAFNEKEKNSILPYIIDSSMLPVAQRFIFSAINRRNMKEHPIETVLVPDLLDLLGRPRQAQQKPGGSIGAGEVFDDAKDAKVDIILEDTGLGKLQVLKIIKDTMQPIRELSLAEAKAICDNVPSVIATMPRREASIIQAKIEEYGATVRLRPANAINLYDVVLEKNGMAKLAIVKEINEILGLGLVEAKSLADNVPSVITKSVSFAYALEVKSRIERIGGTVSIQGQNGRIVK